MRSIKSLILTIAFFSITMQSYGKPIEVQGHRGTRGLRPENTLPSFTAAIEAGVDALELDLLLTKDEIFIIHHNFFVNKNLCTRLDGNPIAQAVLIRSLSLAEIKEFDCGNKANPSFPKQELHSGTQIPTLQELFALIQSSSHPNAKKVRLNLEIKRDPRHPEFTISPALFAKKLLSLVKSNGFSERVYYSSFDPEVLTEVRKLDSQAKIGFIFSNMSLFEANKSDPKSGMEVLVKVASSLKAEVLSPDHMLLKDTENVRALQRSGFRVIPWTVNDPKRWDELIEMGVDGIISDYPQDLIKFLKNKKLR